MKKRCISFLEHFKPMAAVAAVAALAAGVFAQEEDAAQVPFQVNVAATVTAQRGAAVVSMDVAKDEVKTLTIPLEGTGTVWNTGGARGQLNAPAITASRGNINLRLPQSCKSAEIALYSVNGRQIMRGKAVALESAENILRRNVAAGTYLLSIKGVNGGAFATRLTHGGGNLNIKSAFGTEKISSDRRLGKSAAENWNITVSANGYKDSVYTLSVNIGTNAKQNITLRPDQQLLNVVSITFNGVSAPAVDKPADFGNDAVQITGAHVVLDMPLGTTEYNVVVSGTTANGSIKIYNRFNLTLNLNGANITNPTGPAVNIQTPSNSNFGRPVSVNITGTNSLTDGQTYGTPPNSEDAKGTFFSERRIAFSGGGSLEIRSKGGHAIAVDNDLFFNNVNITIPEAEKDGIHANDSIVLTGGTFDIKCRGEAIQNETPAKAIVISGAKVIIATTDAKSHGISSEGDIEIIGTPADSIKISVTGDGSKGIKSRGNMRVTGSDVRVNASGGRHIDNTVNPKDTSNAAGIKVEGDMTVTGGTLVLIATKSGGNGKGINVDGNLTISAGNINASADGDGIKVGGNLNITGGTTKARSATTQDVDVGADKYTIANPSMLDGGINERKN